MSEQGPGTIKYKSHRFHINIGMIICIIIILYFVAYFFDFLVNRSSSFYEVDTGYTSSEFDGQYTALIIRDDQILFQRRTDNGRWGLIGGLLEMNETYEEAALREIREETGLEVRLDSFLGIFHNHDMVWSNF